MKDCCPFACVKNSLVLFNIIFWFSGPAILGLSIWFYLTMNMYSPVIDMTSYSLPSYVMMAAGAGCVVCGICGCLGGVNENKCLIFFFACSITVIFGCQVYSCVATFFTYDKVGYKDSSNLNNSIYHLYHYSDDTTVAMDKIQQELECCGSSGHLDWSFASYYNDITLSDSRGREVLPRSCCYDTTDIQCNAGERIPRDPGKVFTTGCKAVLDKWIKHKLLIFGWGTFAFSSFQLLGITLACCLYKAVSDIYT